MVGHAGFHGPPGVNGRDLPAALELAYTVFAAYRRHGYAREAVAALVDWARSVHGIRRFLASIAPGNEPSTRVVTSIGFVDAGQRWDDEDGLELVFELDTSPIEHARGGVTGAPAALKHRADREYGFCFLPGCEPHKPRSRRPEWTTRRRAG
jgi:hypothetical protein